MALPFILIRSLLTPDCISSQRLFRRIISIFLSACVISGLICPRTIFQFLAIWQDSWDFTSAWHFGENRPVFRFRIAAKPCTILDGKIRNWGVNFLNDFGYRVDVLDRTDTSWRSFQIFVFATRLSRRGFGRVCDRSKRLYGRIGGTTERCTERCSFRYSWFLWGEFILKGFNIIIELENQLIWAKQGSFSAPGADSFVKAATGRPVHSLCIQLWQPLHLILSLDLADWSLMFFSQMTHVVAILARVSDWQFYNKHSTVELVGRSPTVPDGRSGDTLI